MVTVSRRLLRQRLGTNFLRDVVIGNHTGSLPALTGTAFFPDVNVADLSMSGEGLYARQWLKTQGMVLRVASWNAGSGAYVTLQRAATTILSGSEYEVHGLLSPDEKDRALDHVVERLRVRREVTIPTVDGAAVYTLDAAASPYVLERVLDVYALADPTNSLSRDPQRFPNSSWKVTTTATGTELRLAAALPASWALALDAILVPSLGSADTATISLPDESWLLYGAEAQCWELLSKRSPGQDKGTYLKNAGRAWGAYRTLSRRFMPRYESNPRFDDPPA
jgi:hypothetical protein